MPLTSLLKRGGNRSTPGPPDEGPPKPSLFGMSYQRSIARQDKINRKLSAPLKSWKVNYPDPDRVPGTSQNSEAFHPVCIERGPGTSGSRKTLEALPIHPNKYQRLVRFIEIVRMIQATPLDIDWNFQETITNFRAITDAIADLGPQYVGYIVPTLIDTAFECPESSNSGFTLGWLETHVDNIASPMYPQLLNVAQNAYRSLRADLQCICNGSWRSGQVGKGEPGPRSVNWEIRITLGQLSRIEHRLFVCFETARASRDRESFPVIKKHPLPHLMWALDYGGENERALKNNANVFTWLSWQQLGVLKKRLSKIDKLAPMQPILGASFSPLLQMAPGGPRALLQVLYNVVLLEHQTTALAILYVGLSVHEYRCARWDEGLRFWSKPEKEREDIERHIPIYDAAKAIYEVQKWDVEGKEEDALTKDKILNYREIMPLILWPCFPRPKPVNIFVLFPGPYDEPDKVKNKSKKRRLERERANKKRAQEQEEMAERVPDDPGTSKDQEALGVSENQELSHIDESRGKDSQHSDNKSSDAMDKNEVNVDKGKGIEKAEKKNEKTPEVEEHPEEDLYSAGDKSEVIVDKGKGIEKAGKKNEKTPEIEEHPEKEPLSLARA